MKKVNLILVTCLFSPIFLNQIFAAHIIGGELTYECLGNDYLITLKVYRDCQNGGAGFDEEGTMSIYRSDDLEDEFAMAPMPFPTVTSIDPLIGNPCLLSPPELCVQEGIYQFKLSDLGIILPKSSHTYHLVYQRCCRNGTISNIINPGDTGATYSVDITPEAQDMCNNSPVFEAFPPIIVCVNNNLEFVQTASDADGDLLRYELCAPLKGAGTDGATTPGDIFSFTGATPNPDAPPPFNQVDYVVPTYSADAPLAATPSLAIDSISGVLTGYPTIVGQFVVGICVSEYRNGKMLSKVQRDFQFNVDYCEPGVFAEMGGEELIAEQIVQPQYIYYSCGDPNVFFENESYPNEFIDAYEWRFDLGNGDTLISNQIDLDVTFPDLGTYNGILVLNPGSICSDSSYVEVNIYPRLTADFIIEQEDECAVKEVVFWDQSSAEASDILEWFWDFGDGNTSSEKNPTHLYTEPGEYEAVLQVTDSNGCIKRKKETIIWMPAPNEISIASDLQNGCTPINVQFENLSTPFSDVYDIFWEFGDGATSTLKGPDHFYTTEGMYSVKVSISTPLGCEIEKVFENWIEAYPNPTADFSYNPNPVNYFSPTVVFNNESTNYDNITWDFAGIMTSYADQPQFTFPDSGLYNVQMTVVNDYGCTDTTQQLIDVVPEVTLFLPNAFTPNYDGKNDTYFPVGYFDFVKNYNLVIFSRSGEIIFETDDPQQGWNGKNKNGSKIVPTGVYVCVVNYLDARGRYHEVEGFVTVVY